MQAVPVSTLKNASLLATRSSAWRREIPDGSGRATGRTTCSRATGTIPGHRDGAVQVARVGLFGHERQHCGQRVVHVADEAEIDGRPPAQMLRFAVNLHFLQVPVRQKFGEGEIGAE
jgi:hypothetical protein